MTGPVRTPDHPDAFELNPPSTKATRMHLGGQQQQVGKRRCWPPRWVGRRGRSHPGRTERLRPHSACARKAQRHIGAQSVQGGAEPAPCARRRRGWVQQPPGKGKGVEISCCVSRQVILRCDGRRLLDRLLASRSQQLRIHQMSPGRIVHDSLMNLARNPHRAVDDQFVPSKLLHLPPPPIRQ